MHHQTPSSPMRGARGSPVKAMAPGGTPARNFRQVFMQPWTTTDQVRRQRVGWCGVGRTILTAGRPKLAEATRSRGDARRRRRASNPQLVGAADDGDRGELATFCGQKAGCRLRKGFVLSHCSFVSHFASDNSGGCCRAPGARWLALPEQSASDFVPTTRGAGARP